MPLFYRGPHALITHQVISVPRTERPVLALDDLAAVRAVRMGSDLGRVRLLGVSALAAEGLVLPTLGHVSTPLALVTGCALLACAGSCFRARSDVSYKLIAEISGEWVTLVETPDGAEFRQLVRGLRRAFEHRGRQADGP